MVGAQLTDPAPPRPPPAPSRKRKAAVEAPAPDEAQEAPSTPRRKRTAKTKVDPPASPTQDTPTATADEAPTPKPKAAAVARLADPRRTNAVLRSPKTSRIIAPTPVEPIPSKLRQALKSATAETATTVTITAATTTTTTATLLEEACAHLIKTDARMKPLIAAHHCRIFSPAGLAEQVDPFEALCSSIISQQVSGAAAKSIKARFVALFSSTPADTDTATDPPPFPGPDQVAAMSLETLRTAGLSQRKAEYIQGLGSKFAAGELTAQMLADAPYEEILEKLTAVRGLGKWSVEMFACFALKRMDVFSVGDLGVQRGMAAFVGRDVAKLKAKGGGKWKYMGEKEMVEVSERFKPYRSLFMWYMWRVEETDVSTME